MPPLQALAGDASCAIFSDALNHASLVDGCRLAAARGARVHVYRHGDAAHAAELLAASRAPRKLVLTDTLFSMDGDFAPLAALAAAAKRHGAALAVDDAHATLVCGARGEGALPPGVVADVHVGTLSKAVGAQGGFVACSRAMKQLLISTARGQVYSTALPLPTVAAAAAAIKAARDEPWRCALVHAASTRVVLQRLLVGALCSPAWLLTRAPRDAGGRRFGHACGS